MSDLRDIVVTGMGVVTPIGIGREEFWSGVQGDVVRCLQMTVMVFLTAWGVMS